MANTIPDLVTTIAKYCRKTPAELVTGEVDLILEALNSVKLEAQQLRDFQLSKGPVQLTVDKRDGVLLTEGIDPVTEDIVRVKSVISASLPQIDGTLIPTRFSSMASLLAEQERDKEHNYSEFDPEIRYPSDADTTARARCNSRIVQDGGRIYNYPFGTAGDTIVVRLNAFLWLPEYADADDADYSDFMLQFCFNYLKWAAIVECNHISKSFVPRVEGELAPPNQRMERAWTAVEKWDDFLLAQAE